MRVFASNGYGSGNGYGDGNGNGNGNGNGDGDGYGDGERRALVQYTTILPVGYPVVLRSYVSGVFVGRLAAGEAGTVALTDWRWLRRWEGVGGEGAVYDLVRSDVKPGRRGPLTAEVAVFQQADVMAVSEEVYERLALDEKLTKANRRNDK